MPHDFLIEPIKPETGNRNAYQFELSSGKGGVYITHESYSHAYKVLKRKFSKYKIIRFERSGITHSKP